MGVIRTIREIQEHIQKNQNRKLTGFSLENENVRAKFNVFDPHDSTQIKKEKLYAITEKEKDAKRQSSAMVPYDSRSQTSLHTISTSQQSIVHL